MTCTFTFILTEFQSYQEDARVIMKSFVYGTPFTDGKISNSSGSQIWDGWISRPVFILLSYPGFLRQDFILPTLPPNISFVLFSCIFFFQNNPKALDMSNALELFWKKITAK